MTELFFGELPKSFYITCFLVHSCCQTKSPPSSRAELPKNEPPFCGSTKPEVLDMWNRSHGTFEFGMALQPSQSEWFL